MTVKLRYKEPDGVTSSLMTVAGPSRSDITPALGFAAAVAEFGMLLRDSEFKGSRRMRALPISRREYKGADDHGHRAEFLTIDQRSRQREPGAGIRDVSRGREGQDRRDGRDGRDGQERLDPARPTSPSALSSHQLHDVRLELFARHLARDDRARPCPARSMSTSVGVASMP